MPLHRKGVRTIPTKNDKPVTVKEIQDLLKQGLTVAQAAEKLNISRQAVYQKLREEKRKQGLVTYADDVKSRLASPHNQAIIEHIGDAKATAFVQYHIDLFKMGQGCDPKDVPGLYQRFANYLEYCSTHGIVPNNMSAYLAIGVPRDRIWNWQRGNSGTPEHRKFAEDISAFFAAIHEQGGTDGLMNPIQTIFWQKAYDGLSDQPKVEIEVTNPLGEKRNAEQIAQAYGEVELPD